MALEHAAHHPPVEIIVLDDEDAKGRGRDRERGRLLLRRRRLPAAIIPAAAAEDEGRLEARAAAILGVDGNLPSHQVEHAAADREAEARAAAARHAARRLQRVDRRRIFLQFVDPRLLRRRGEVRRR